MKIDCFKHSPNIRTVTFFFMSTFEQRFKLIRGAMNQVEFADLVGITKQKVSNYENGVVKPTFEVFYLLATKLNVNLNWLFTGAGSMLIDDTSKRNIKRKVIHSQV